MDDLYTHNMDTRVHIFVDNEYKWWFTHYAVHVKFIFGVISSDSFYIGQMRQVFIQGKYFRAEKLFAIFRDIVIENCLHFFFESSMGNHQNESLSCYFRHLFDAIQSSWVFYWKYLNHNRKVHTNCCNETKYLSLLNKFSHQDTHTLWYVLVYKTI